MKTKYLIQTLVIFSVSLTTSIVFATGMHLSTNPNAKPYVFHLSTNPARDKIELPKKVDASRGNTFHELQLNSNSLSGPPFIGANPSPGISRGPGSCISFVMSPKTGKYTFLYNRCGWTPFIVDSDGKVGWAKYRYVTVDWTTDPKHIASYVLVPDGGLETGRTDGVIIGDAPGLSPPSQERKN